MQLEEILAWGLPSLCFVAWAVTLGFALPRLMRRLMPQGRWRGLAVAGLYAGLVALGLWLWAVAVPLPHDARDVVVNRLEPWFWGTLTLLLFVVGGLLVLRRGLAFLAAKSAGTRSYIDDAVVVALRRPAHLLVMFVGFVLWVELVPAPEGVIAHVGMISEVVIIAVLALFADGIVTEVIRQKRATSRVFATAGTVLGAMARIVMFIVAALMIFSTIGIAITPIVASLGVGSLAIGLALQGTLEDFIAGLLIAADQPITIGDYVELGENRLSGTVDAIGWRTTRILTRERTKVIVPNAVLAKSTIINRSRPSPELRFQVLVGVHYDSDLQRVARVVHDVAKRIQESHPYATRDFDPEVNFLAFGDSSVNLEVWLEATDWLNHFDVHDAFIRGLHERFREEKIVIPYPIRTLDLPPEVRQALARPGPRSE